MSRRPANDEMVRGFMDGYDPTVPEPSANRTASYRHGFMVGRLDNTPADYGKYSAGELELLADLAMDEDEALAGIGGRKQ